VWLTERQRAALARACARHGLDLVVGFGSRFAGTAGARSDVDVAVRVRPKAPRPDRLDLVADLAEVFGERVDVTVLNDVTSETLRFEVFRAGVLLHEGEPDLFACETSLAMRRYFDTAWLRERSRQALARAMEAQDREAEGAARRPAPETSGRPATGPAVETDG
jgi:predicted nucleotidyltransferase